MEEVASPTMTDRKENDSKKFHGEKSSPYLDIKRGTTERNLRLKHITVGNSNEKAEADQ